MSIAKEKSERLKSQFVVFLIDLRNSVLDFHTKHSLRMFFKFDVKRV